jgi:uncharacterized damage-inducible protein DinB
MMKEVERLEGELRRAHEGDSWHGPSLKELLSGVSAESAAARPISGAHTIWELVLHITAWERAAIDGLAGDEVQLPEEENWPPVVDKGEASWNKALQELRDTNKKLRSEVSGMNDSRLEETVKGKDYTISVMLHGVVQHGLYHAGQIALLTKLNQIK